MASDQHLLRGTLDLLILKSLSWGPRHGYSVSEWIESVTHDALHVMEGTVYPALHRMEDKGWIEAEWGKSETNRRAKYYSLTRAGRRQLRSETSRWEVYAQAMSRALSAKTPELGAAERA